MSVPLQEDKQLRIATARAQDGNPSAVPEALCPLIDTLGTPDFGQHLFVSVERMLGANAAAVYAFGGGARGTRMIMGDWSGGPDLSDATVQRHTSEYAERYAADDPARLDRKSTRLNSSHLGISYAVFCLKKNRTQYF